MSTSISPTSGNYGPPPGFQNGPPPGFEKGPPPPGDMITAMQYIWRIVPPILIVVGTVGNALTILIILRKFHKATSTAFFLLTLAVSDTLFLFNAPLRQFIRHTHIENGQTDGYDVRKYSEAGCKVSVYLTYASSHFSSWLLVAVTVERFISVTMPHKVKMGCTPKVSIVIITSLFITIFGLNAHILYGFGKSDLPFYQGQAICEPLYQSYFDFFHLYWPWIDFAVVFGIPFVILVVCNTTIICMIRRAHTRRRRLSMIQSEGHKAQAKDTKSVTIMLVLLTVMFLVCLTPSSIYFIYLPYKKDELEPLMYSDPLEYIRQTEIMLLTHAITNCIGYFNAALNFLLYVLSGAKFRNEVKSLLCCKEIGTDGVFWSSTRDSKLASSSRTRSTATSISSNRGSVSGKQDIGGNGTVVKNSSDSSKEQTYL